jgi:hypothetical protein
MKLIATLDATGSANTFFFDNIPQTYTDLVIVGSIRNAVADFREGVGLAFNSTFSGYSNRRLMGQGTSVSSSFESTYNSIAEANAANSTASIFNNFEIYVPNYKSSTNKSVSSSSVVSSATADSRLTLIAYLQTVTSPITQVSVFSNTNGTNWVAGSTVSLYGITAGSDGVVTTS